jgi:hypothetical protein
VQGITWSILLPIPQSCRWLERDQPPQRLATFTRLGTPGSAWLHAVTDDDGVMVVVEHTPKPRRPSDAAGTWRGKHG